MKYYRDNPDEPIRHDWFEGCQRVEPETPQGAFDVKLERDFESLLSPELDEHFCSAPLTDSDIDELQQQKDI